MIDFFQKRGYPRKTIVKGLRRAEKFTREEILQKPKEKNRLPLTFPIVHNEINKKVTKIIQRNFSILSEDEEVHKIFESRPLIAYKRGTNLKDILVHSVTKSSHPEAGTFSCGRTRCYTCRYVIPAKTIQGPKGLFNIKDKFTCISKALIYAIECEKCGHIYVGETGRRLGDRFVEHRLSVIKKDQTKAVGEHFSSIGHSVEDMKVSGLVSVTDLHRRKLLEQKIIGKLGCLQGLGGMNIDFNFMNVN